MRIAVLALQGAFIEHEQVLQRLGAETVEIRQLSDWQSFYSFPSQGKAQNARRRMVVRGARRAARGPLPLRA